MEKICKKCNINKNINEYQKDIRGKFGVESKCKNCRNIYLKKYKDKTNYDKIYYENNKENIIKKQKLYVKNNKENYNKYQNIYKKSNGYKSQKLYNSKNKEILLKKSYTRRNNKVKKDKTNVPQIISDLHNIGCFDIKLSGYDMHEEIQNIKIK
jgi:hypothetical protein